MGLSSAGRTIEGLVRLERVAGDNGLVETSSFASGQDRWRNSLIELRDGRMVGLAEFGPVDGYPILWFHGTPGARRQVPPDAVEHAYRVGVRIIGVERPGVGRSTPHHYDRIIDFAADVKEVLDRLGLAEVGLIGLSGGGPYVLAVAAGLDGRVSAAAVLGGVGPSAGPEKITSGPNGLLRRFHPVVRKLREPVGWAMTAAVKCATPVADRAFNVYVRFGPKADQELLMRPEMREMFLDDLLTAGRVSFRAVAYDAALFSRWWGFDVADIEVPVYFWHGDADKVVPLDHGERMADLVPNSTLSVVAGKGHLGMLDAAEEAIDKILSHRATEQAQAPPSMPPV